MLSMCSLCIDLVYYVFCLILILVLDFYWLSFLLQLLSLLRHLQSHHLALHLLFRKLDSLFLCLHPLEKLIYYSSFFSLYKFFSYIFFKLYISCYFNLTSLFISKRNYNLSVCILSKCNFYFFHLTFLMVLKVWRMLHIQILIDVLSLAFCLPISYKV